MDWKKKRWEIRFELRMLDESLPYSSCCRSCSCLWNIQLPPQLDLFPQIHLITTRAIYEFSIWQLCKHGTSTGEFNLESCCWKILEGFNLHPNTTKWYYLYFRNYLIILTRIYWHFDAIIKIVHENITASRRLKSMTAVSTGLLRSKFILVSIVLWVRRILIFECLLKLINTAAAVLWIVYLLARESDEFWGEFGPIYRWNSDVI